MLTVTPTADFETVGGINYHTGTAAVDALTGAASDETFVGYGGSDTLTGGGGKDTFAYRQGNIGADTIADFTVRASGATAAGANDDVLNLSNLLQGYVAGASAAADFVRLVANGATGATLKVDFNGHADGSSFTPYFNVNLTGVTLASTGAASFDDLLATMRTSGQMVL